MALPKLYTQLKALPVKVLDLFTHYLHSPLHHGHADTQQLWRAIRSTYPDFAADDAAVFAAAFPGAPYDNARLRVLRSYLVDHLERFLALQELERDTALRHRLLRRAAARHALPMRTKTSPLSSPDEPFFDPDLALEAFLIAQDQLRTDVQEANRAKPHEMEPVLLPLDAYYLMTRLKYLCALADPTTRLQPMPMDATVGGVLALCASPGMQAQPMVAIYHRLLLLFLHPDQEHHLQETRHLLQAHEARLDPHECLNLYTYLLNFLILQSRRGRTAASMDMFALYKEMVKVDAFWGERSFAANHFRNIVMVGANLGEFEWVHAFLEEFSPRLGTFWRAGVYAYCKGFLLFAQGKYADAKRSLVHAEFHDAEYKVNQQMLFARIYYETDDASGIEGAKDALKMFLYRNKEVPASARESANNFMRFALRLFHLRGLPQNAKALQKIVGEMQECPQLRERNWLYAKAREMGADC